MSAVNAIGRQRQSQLSAFLLSDVKRTGKTLGTGSYGSVLEVECQGSIYAAKKIHDTLLDQQNDGVDLIFQKYQMECRLMTDLRHPNIVQFLGLFFEGNSQTPLLVMEKLEMNLDDLLESVTDLSLLTKLSILGNIASGLVYLHSRPSPIIHRDLTATNVLLTDSLVAKISDLGNSRIPNMRPDQRVMMMSEVPGTAVYMPPEALQDDSQYGTHLDVFSFGHLSLYVMIQNSPCELLSRTLPTRYPRGGRSSLARQLPVRSELERRKKYFDQFEHQLGGNHQELLLLIKRCLNNQPLLRPCSQVLVAQLKSMKAGVEEKQRGSIVLQKMDISKVLLTREMAERDKNMKELKDELQASRSQIRCLEEEKQRQCSTIDDLRKESEVKAVELLRKEEELHEVKVTKQLLQDRVVRKESEWDTRKAGWDTQKASWEEQKAVYEERIKIFQDELQRVPKMPPVVPHHITPMPDIKWARGPDMPFRMTGNVQAAFVQEIMYVGGGDTKKVDNDYVVLFYNTTTFEWSRLPTYSSRHFGLVAIKDELILLGGRDRLGQSVSVVGVYNQMMKVWEHPYKPMPQAQISPSAVAYDNDWIIVVESFIAPVQLFNYQLKSWYEILLNIPASFNYSSIRSLCTIGSSLYMKDSSNFVHVSLAPLIDLAKSVQSKDKYDCSLLSSRNTNDTKLVGFNGSLLSIQRNFFLRNKIIHYNAGTCKLIGAGELPAKVLCHCAVVSSDQKELWIIGGNVTNEIYVGRIV